MPTDTFSSQILRVATYTESYARGVGESICGISLDASKCFDRIDWSQIANLACEQGVPHGIVRAVLSFYVSHKRYSSLGGKLDGVSWSLSRGLLQGCSLSVAFTLALVSRWHYALGAGIKSLSFVDDRILLSRTSGELEEAWQQSQMWDRSHGWRVNTSKTNVFAVGQPTPRIEVGQETLAQPKVFKYLGSEIHLAPLQPRIVLQKRISAAMSTLKRIAQLPATIGINALLKTVETTAMPQLTYGFHAREVPLVRLRELAAAVRRAVWRGQADALLVGDMLVLLRLSAGSSSCGSSLCARSGGGACVANDGRGHPRRYDPPFSGTSATQANGPYASLPSTIEKARL